LWAPLYVVGALEVWVDLNTFDIHSPGLPNGGAMNNCLLLLNSNLPSQEDEYIDIATSPYIDWIATWWFYFISTLKPRVWSTSILPSFSTFNSPTIIICPTFISFYYYAPLWGPGVMAIYMVKFHSIGGSTLASYILWLTGVVTRAMLYSWTGCSINGNRSLLSASSSSRCFISFVCYLLTCCTCSYWEI